MRAFCTKTVCASKPCFTAFNLLAALPLDVLGPVDFRAFTRFAARFADALGEIGARVVPAGDKLEAYCAIYRAVLAEQRMCLCGMLAAEYEALPEPMRRAVVQFFDHTHVWLSALLEEGRRARSLRFAGTSDQAAHSITAALEGAMLVSRPYGNTAVLASVADRLIAEFSGEA